MTAQRIVVLVILALVAVYVAVVHFANPTPIALPGFLSLPLWLILVATGGLAYLAGWLPGAIRTWRMRRDHQRLERRIEELEAHLPSYAAKRTAPVIPDRAATETRTPSNDGEGGSTGPMA